MAKGRSLLVTATLALVLGIMLVGMRMCNKNSKYMDLFIGGNDVITRDTEWIYQVDTAWYPDTVVEWRMHERPTKVRWRDRIVDSIIYVEMESEDASSIAVANVDTLMYINMTVHEFADGLVTILDTLLVTTDTVFHAQKAELTSYIEKEVINHYDTTRITNTIVDRKLRLWVGTGTDYNFMFDAAEKLPTNVPIIISIQNQKFELGISKDILTPTGYIYVKMPIRNIFKKFKRK